MANKKVEEKTNETVPPLKNGKYIADATGKPLAFGNEPPTPNIEGVVEPVIQTDAKVPVVEIEKTVTEPLVEPTAIVPNIVHEINAAAAPSAEAPQVLTTKGANATRVEVIFDGMLGHKSLRKGDITDDAEYVALLKTERSRQLVREVK